MESNLVKCKVCQELKVKIESGFYPSEKKRTKKYIDQFGKIWNGKTCPQCNQERAKNTMKSSRLKEPTE